VARKKVWVFDGVLTTDHYRHKLKNNKEALNKI
jgi:hypothetical protein